MERRAFLTAFAISPLILASSEASASPGISASPELFSAFTSLRGVSEGRGQGTMHVLFAPWCPLTPQLYEDTRPFLGRMRINWMPFSGGQREGRYGTEYLLESASAADVPKSFTRIGTVAPLAQTPLSDAQDAALSGMVHLYYRDAGGSLRTPTIFYKMPGERIRVVKGAPEPRHIEEIANLAA